MRWRVRAGRRRPARSATALTIVLAMAIGDVAITASIPRTGGGGGHRAQPAPAQRWGSAAGQAHLVGSGANRTRPASLRSRYPWRAVAPVPPAPPNEARVVPPPATRVPGFDRARSVEVPAQRQAFQRTYDNVDGTQTTEFAATPLHYRRGDAWYPIDSRLVPVAGGWRNAADTVDIRLADRAAGGDLVRLAFDRDHQVSFGLEGASAVRGVASGATVTYAAVRPRTDLRFEVHGGGVKETLVLRGIDAPRAFSFPLRLTGLSARLVDGRLVLADAGGREWAAMPAGFMVDAAGTVAAGGVSYALTSVDGQPALRVDLDGAWLADPRRVYPVQVDPSVDPAAADGALVVHGGSSRSGSTELLVGNQGGAAAASYLRFDGVASRLRFHTIYGAQLQVVNYDAPSCRPRAMSVHPVTQAWSTTGSYSYPGPSVGAALATSSFAYGFIPVGQSTSACPAAAALLGLGTAGRDLVQGWVNGGANHGLSLRASDSDTQAWKRLAGTGTANAPRLFVTHSAYNAKYAIANPVPEPPVLQNQAGKVTVTVTNASAETWTPATYYLAYRAYNAATGAPVTQRRAANLPADVARGGRVTLEATIAPLPVGRYFLDFTMVRTGGPVFTDEQVPPARIVLQVFNIPPVVRELYPPNGHPAPTLTPMLWAQAVDIDAPPGSTLRFKFAVCEGNGSGAGTNCLDSGYLTSPAWTVPAGRLAWSKTYQWRAFVNDGLSETASPWSVLLSSVPQPDITSHLAGAPFGGGGQEFDAQVGNVTTAATDASVATVGPPLTLVRTYNSLDPGRDAGFGAGWMTQYDMRLVPDDDGSGNVVLTYPDGQQVRFGRNPDASYAAPPGRVATLTTSGTQWILADRAGTRYQFAGPGTLSRISDASGRSVVLGYDTAGRLATATAALSQTATAGRTLRFGWTGNHVTTVRTDPVDGVALTWSYTYSGDLLTRVCAPSNACTTYTYAAGSHYRSAVLDSRPETYLRLAEASGPAAASAVAVNLGRDAGRYANVTLAAPGAVAGSDDTAATFNGSSSVLALPKGLLKRSRDAAVEVWFKVAPTQTGGPLLGYQDREIGASPTAGGPLLYVDTGGQLRGQFRSGAVAPLASPGRVNDGQWHHAVLSVLGTAQTLYLDGVRVAGGTVAIDQATMTFGQAGAAYTGAPASWPGWGSAARRYFSGSLDELAVYAHPLGAPAVAAHFRYGRQAADQLAAVTLPSGRIAIRMSYDASTDRVREYTDPNGGTWRIGAPLVHGGDADLRRTVEVLDPAGRPYLYEYDALTGRLLRSGSPAGLGPREEDRPGAPTATPTPSPTPTCTQPDPNDPRFCTTIPGNADGPVFDRHPLDGMAIRTFSYDDNGFANVITDENGSAVTLAYDARGNVTSRRTCRTATECHTAYTTYPTGLGPLDPRADLPTETRDARSAGPTDTTYRTTYTYTPAGNLLTQSNPDGGVVRHTYTNGTEPAVGGGATPPGLPAQTTDARGAITRFQYHANGDLAAVVEPSGLKTTYQYDPLGRRIGQTETSDTYPGGLTTTYGYDSASRLVSTVEPATTNAVGGGRHQRRTTQGFDADGNLLRVDVADALGGDATRTTVYEYDAHNRVSRITDAEGGETSIGYDQFGNRTSVVDANGTRIEYAYTARNAVAEVRLRAWRGDPPGVPSPGDYLVVDSYAYDFGGRMVRHTDAMGRRMEYAYNGDSTLARTTLRGLRNPDGSTRDYVVEANTYDAAGNVTLQVAGNGTTAIRQTFTRAGQVESVTSDPTGLARRTSYAYDAAGNVTRVTRDGAASNVPWVVPVATDRTDYGYDAIGNLVTETAVNGSTNRVTTHRYDQRGLRIATVDPRGNVTGADPAAYTTTRSYDERERLVSLTGAPVAAEQGGAAPQTVSPRTTFGLDTFDGVVDVRDERGFASTTAYDRLGRVTAASAPSYTTPGGVAIRPTVRHRYDAVGNLTEQTDPRGNVFRFGYDQLGRLTTRDEPAATNDQRAVWRYTYTRTGDVLSETAPTGARTEYTYDELDRQVTSTVRERFPVADTFTTRYTYDDGGNLIRTTAPSGAALVLAYDGMGELVRMVDANGVTIQRGYDFAGNVVRNSDGLGRTTRIDYDSLGQVTAEADLAPAGAVLRTRRNAYDPVGNLVRSTDPYNRDTVFSYDAANRLTRQVEPVSATESITTTFGYDAAGNRTRYTDGRGNVTVYTVNSLGLPDSVVEPATVAYPNAADRTWTVGYDAAGNGVRLSAPGGVARQRTFDAAGRLAVESGAGAEAATAERRLGYDLAHRLTSASAPGGTNTYAYDDRNNLLSTSGPSGAATFAYDNNGDLVTRTDAAGTSRFTYTGGRLTTRTDAVTGTLQRLGYDAAGSLSTVDYGAGRVRTYGYDDFGRPVGDTLRNTAGRTVTSIGYGYDLNDNLTAKSTTGTAGATDNTYTYDYAGRLTGWTAGAGPSVPYAWDASGNRTRAGTKVATYDARNRLLSDGDYSYRYTARGTVAGRTSSGLTETFTFDAFDRMVGTGAQTYAYDGLDRLASRTGTAFAYGGLGDEVVSSGVERYARGSGDELLAVARGQTRRVVLSDEHDDVVAAFDPANTGLDAVNDSTAFDPFGRVLARTGAPTEVGFQGDWTDPATGQVDMGRRWYDPGTGTFDSRDGATYAAGDSILANRYTYAAGDPLDNVDPDGQWPSCGWCRKSVAKVAAKVVKYVAPVAKQIAHVAYRVAAPVVRFAVSVTRAVVSRAVAAARWVANRANAAVHWVGRQVSSAAKWAAGRAVAVARSFQQRAAAFRAAAARAAIAAAHRVTNVARKAVAYAVRHNPVRAIAAAAKAVYAGAKIVVSTAARLPAAVVATVRTVVRDAAAAAQAVYQKAVAAAGVVVEAVTTTVRAVSEFAQAAAPTLLGIAAGVATTAGCLAVTAGAGSAACVVAGFAVGSAVTGALSCAPGRSVAGCAVKGGAAGLAAGAVFVATGGTGSGLSAAIVAGAASSAAGSATEQVLETGSVDAGSLATSAALGAATGGAGNRLSLRFGRSAPPTRCENSFTPETPVLMADGSTRPISQVRVGDTVRATDPVTGRTEARRVTDTIVGEGVKHLVRVTVERAGGARGALTATDNHPFWTVGRRAWVDATDLRVGDTLRTPGGDTVRVVELSRWTARAQRVYNLTVDGLHTYYTAAGTAPVLVHNCDPADIPNLDPDHLVDLDTAREIVDRAKRPKVDDLSPEPGTARKPESDPDFETRMEAIEDLQRIADEPNVRGWRKVARAFLPVQDYNWPFG